MGFLTKRDSTSGVRNMADKIRRKARSHSKIPNAFKPIIVKVKKKIAVGDPRPTFQRLQEEYKHIPKQEGNNDNIPSIRLVDPFAPIQNRTHRPSRALATLA
jgi:hypothetical protein